MTTASNALSELFARHEHLVSELIAVNTRLRATAERGAAGAPGKGSASSNSVRLPAKSKRRKWFERGEALVMLKKLATKPMAQADLVRALTVAKRYDKKLSSAEQKKFHSAAYQAIANAVTGKKLVAAKDGTVRARM